MNLIRYKIYLLGVLFVFLTPGLGAQVCDCIDCPGDILPGSTSEYHVNIAGAVNNDLTAADQGVCGVILEFEHEFVWDMTISLTSPSGQKFLLIGPDADPPLGAYSGFAIWDILLKRDTAVVYPDPGFSVTWDNDQDWQVAGRYRGSYYPVSGTTLEQFNTGPVNGSWTLEVVSSSGFYPGRLINLSLIFCDDTGLNCVQCQADAGSLARYADRLACKGSTDLAFNLVPEYTGIAPDPLAYSYSFVVSRNDTIVQYQGSPDLRSLPTGTYQICGFSYKTADASRLPAPNQKPTLNQLRQFTLDPVNPWICGQLTTDCILVNITPGPTVVINDTLCAGDLYLFKGDLISTSGTYRDTSVSVDGCDSLTILNLTVRDSIITTIRTQLCQGDSIDVNGVYYKNPGTYTIPLTAMNGCDSILRLQLEVFPSYSELRNEIICDGDTTYIGNNVYTSAGLFNNIFTTINGCDSIIQLQLTVIPAVVTYLDESICAGSTFTVAGNVYSSSGNYRDTLTAFSGCDSVVVLDLEVLPELRSAITFEICQGDSVAYNGVWYKGSTTLPILLSSQNGCDSTIDLTVIVRPVYLRQIDTSICAGEVFRIGPYAFATQGIHTANFTSIYGCDSIILLQLEVGGPVANIIPPGVLTCTQNELVLDATLSSNRPGINYTWTHLDNGSDGISGPETNNTVRIRKAGTYRMVIAEITNSGLVCRDTAEVLVTADFNPPSVFALGATLNCRDTLLTVEAAVLPTNAALLWSGPGGFSSNILRPQVRLPGNYILTATGLNGCAASDTVLISQDLTPPLAFTDDDTLSCSKTTVLLVGQRGPSAVASYWKNAAGQTLSNNDTLLVTMAGNYIYFTIGSNGCISSVTSTVNLDAQFPVVSLNTDTITCNLTTVPLNATVDRTWSTVQWRGPNGFVSDVLNTSTQQTGVYTFTVVLANGCSSTQSVEVIETINPPLLNLTGDSITCANANVLLTATVVPDNALVSWTGPSGLLIATDTFRTTLPGLYEVIATLPNGCKDTARYLVTVNKTVPVLSATADRITCARPFAALSGTIENGVQAELAGWRFPNGLFLQFPSTSTPDSGWYEFFVLGTNGCKDSVRVFVQKDSQVPALISTTDTITCLDSSLDLSVSDPGNTRSVQWDGPLGFTGSGFTVSNSQPGFYNVIVTQNNDCQAGALLYAGIDTLAPRFTLIQDTFDCNTTNIVLQWTSPFQGVPNWTGPAGWNSTVANPVIAVPGTYTLVLGNPVTGCIYSDSITIPGIPNDWSISVRDTVLPCQSNGIRVMATASKSITQWSWTGPGSFTGTGPTILVQQPGDYTVTAIDENGCSNRDTLRVTAGGDFPNVVLTADSIRCNTGTAFVQASSDSTGVIFNWKGPGAFTGTGAILSVSLPGWYVVTAQTQQGCTVTDSIEVILNNPFYGMVGFADTLSCIQDSSWLQVRNPDPAFDYRWLGENGFDLTGTRVLSQGIGIYQLIITSPELCTDTQTVFVVRLPDPTVDAGPNRIINCRTLGVLLDGTFTGGDQVLLRWSTGNNATVALGKEDTYVKRGGWYYLHAIDFLTGCRAVDSVEVTYDTLVPDVRMAALNARNFNCVTDSIFLDASNSFPAGILEFRWFYNYDTLSHQPAVVATKPGLYSLVIIDLRNYCLDSISYTFRTDTLRPEIFMMSDTSLNCYGKTFLLSADSIRFDTSRQYTLLWEGGQILSNPEADEITIGASGTYTLTVTGDNGCTDSAEVTIDNLGTAPTANIAASPPSCPGMNDGSIRLNGLSGGTPPLQYAIADTTKWLDYPQVYQLGPGTWPVRITDALGCTWDTLITFDLPVGPLVTLGQDTSIWRGTSATITAEIVHPGNGIASWLWENQPLGCTDCTSFVVSPYAGPQFYIITVIDSLGCKWTDTVRIDVLSRNYFSAPSAFTPNQDDQNDRFQLLTSEEVIRIKRLSIFDRWGELVYGVQNPVANDPASGWDGTHKGQPLNPGVFVWVAELEMIDGHTEVVQGDCTLIR